MERVTEYIFRMPSDSDAMKMYIVDITPGSYMTCSCTAFAINRNRYLATNGGQGTCKHLKRVLSDLGSGALKKRENETTRLVVEDLHSLLDEMEEI